MEPFNATDSVWLLGKFSDASKRKVASPPCHDQAGHCSVSDRNEL